MATEGVEWLDRAGIAARLSERLGREVSPRSISELPIPYRVVLKKAVSHIADVDAYADDLLAKAALRVGGRRRRPAIPADAA
jgi:hypothetical protein